VGIIDGWRLPWPEIQIPPYRAGRVGARELKRQVQLVPKICAENYLLIPEVAFGCR
jgi:hypothetical protein